MDTKFYCHLCKLSFLSSYALAQHLRSKEHRDKLNFGTDSIIEKFIKNVRKSIVGEESDEKES